MILKSFFVLSLLSGAFGHRSQAGELDIDLPGLAYHIGANSENPAYTGAPRRLDKNGVFVFNPGLGIGYDFRSQSTQNGWSILTKGVYFQDCDARDFFTLGGGARYRYMLSKRFSADLNAMLMLSAGQEWQLNEYVFGWLPVLLLGGNYHFENDMTAGLNLTLAPRNTAFSATSGFWIIFTMLQISFPIAQPQSPRAM